jgi:hypothetical protein
MQICGSQIVGASRADENKGLHFSQLSSLTVFVIVDQQKLFVCQQFCFVDRHCERSEANMGAR